jgi:hypothetical protein
MGLEFLNSYTKMLDGEKDPRNLMLLFSMDRVILLEFDVKDVIEVTCYTSTVASKLILFIGHVRHNLLLLPYIFQTSTE